MIIEWILAIPALAGLLLAFYAVLTSLRQPEALLPKNSPTPGSSTQTSKDFNHSDADVADLQLQIESLRSANTSMKERLEAYASESTRALDRQEIALQAMSLSISDKSTDIAEEIDVIISERR